MLVRPTQTFNSIIPGEPSGVVLSPADVLRDDNPHVRSHPDMFEPVRATVGPFNDVETASARPGERRNR